MGILAALTVTAAIALGGSPAHGVVFGTEASNKHLAEVQAQRTLRTAPQPPGAEPVAQSPAPALDEALGTRGEPNLVQRVRWLVAPGTVLGVLAWFDAHRPPGFRRDGSTLDVEGAEPVQSIWLESVEHSRRVYGPTLIPIVARLPDHRVGIRLEVQQVWKTPHPAAAKVPAGARFLAVSRRVDGGKAKWQLIRSPRRVRRVAHVIDQLPAHQPQVVYGCGGISELPGVGPKRVNLRLVFRARQGGPLLAEAEDHVPGGFCNPMTLNVKGDRRTFQLEAGDGLLALLRH
jgi:hypothetical protein